MVNLSTGSIPVLLTVSELTLDIQQCLEERYDWVQVRGEISTFKKAPSGHAYFRLKDDGAVLECVAWKSTVIRWSGLELKDGDEVVAGGVSLYILPGGSTRWWYQRFGSQEWALCSSASRN